MNMDKNKTPKSQLKRARRQRDEARIEAEKAQQSAKVANERIEGAISLLDKARRLLRESHAFAKASLLEIQRLEYEARNARELKRAMHEIEKRTAGEKPDTSDLGQDVAVMVICYHNMRKERDESRSAMEELEAALGGSGKPRELVQILIKERDEARAELTRLRGLMGDVADELEIQGAPCYGIREKLREAAKGEK